MEIFFQQLVNGLSLGCIYALIALGYTLIFGVIQIIFFAQGDLAMIGAFLALGTLKLLESFLGTEPSPILAIPFVFGVPMLGTAIVGLLAERVAIRPIRKAPRIKGLITSLGVSIVLQNAIMVTISSNNLSFSPLFAASYNVGGVSVKALQLFLFALTVVLMWSLHLFVTKNRIGLAIRAISESHSMAELMGIPVNRIIQYTFVLGAFLATFAGVIMGMYYGIVKYDMGLIPGIKGFTAAVLGGVGNFKGAMLGGLLLGVIEAFGAGYISSNYKDVFAFIILVAILVLKPSGLLGERLSQQR